MIQEFPYSRLLQLRIAKAEDETYGPRDRTNFRHQLIRMAESENQHDVWVDVAKALIRIAEKDDLTPDVSDHFVRVCPKAIFKLLPIGNAACRFHGWERKMREACAEQSR